MKRAVLAVLAALFVAGCTSTVVLGTLAGDGGNPDLGTDFAHPHLDGFDGGPGDLFDGGFDGGSFVDLAL